MKPIRYYANEQLVTRVQKITGLTRRESQVAVMATTMAILEQLLAGREVALRDVGALQFWMARARMIPERPLQNGVVLPAMALKARPLLKFKVSPKLKKQLAAVEPEVVRLPSKWSDQRHPITPIPSPSPGGSASPSNPPTGDEAA